MVTTMRGRLFTPYYSTYTGPVQSGPKNLNIASPTNYMISDATMQAMADYNWGFNFQIPYTALSVSESVSSDVPYILGTATTMAEWVWDIWNRAVNVFDYEIPIWYEIEYPFGHANLCTNQYAVPGVNSAACVNALGRIVAYDAPDAAYEVPVSTTGAKVLSGAGAGTASIGAANPLWIPSIQLQEDVYDGNGIKTKPGYHTTYSGLAYDGTNYYWPYFYWNIPVSEYEKRLGLCLKILNNTPTVGYSWENGFLPGVMWLRARTTAGTYTPPTVPQGYIDYIVSKTGTYSEPAPTYNTGDDNNCYNNQSKLINQYWVPNQVGIYAGTTFAGRMNLTDVSIFEEYWYVGVIDTVYGATWAARIAADPAISNTKMFGITTHYYDDSRNYFGVIDYSTPLIDAANYNGDGSGNDLKEIKCVSTDGFNVGDIVRVSMSNPTVTEKNLTVTAVNPPHNISLKNPLAHIFTEARKANITDRTKSFAGVSPSEKQRKRIICKGLYDFKASLGRPLSFVESEYDPAENVLNKIRFFESQNAVNTTEELDIINLAKTD